ncbi:MAG: hypothetical protein JWQ64_1801 [Subtercola sp.]|jgi:mycofactocin precursor|nr:hypothetical protein [Subtercola sp.]
MTTSEHTSVAEPVTVHDAGLQTSDLDQVIAEDSLVEEVSIDGMCGVY